MRIIRSLIFFTIIVLSSSLISCNKNGNSKENEAPDDNTTLDGGTSSYCSYYFDDFFYPKKITLSQPYGTRGMSWGFDRTGRYSYEEVKQIREELGDNKGGYRDDTPNAPYICKLTSINMSCEDKWYGIEAGETWNPYVTISYLTYSHFDSVLWVLLPERRKCTLADIDLSEWNLVRNGGNIEFAADHTPPMNSVFVLTLTGEERTLTCRFMYNPPKIIILDE